MPRNARILISFKELEWLEKNEKMKKTTSTKKNVISKNAKNTR